MLILKYSVFPYNVHSNTSKHILMVPFFFSLFFLTEQCLVLNETDIEKDNLFNKVIYIGGQ